MANGTATLYKDGITVKKKCFNKEALDAFIAWADSNSKSKKLLDGIESCFVSNSTGYFDFFDSSTPVELLPYSFAIVGGDKYKYAVLIERYELNNFTYQDESITPQTRSTYQSSYRAYFTVDWWTTYLLGNANPPAIYGAVARGHVCDWDIDIYDSLLHIPYWITPTQEYSFINKKIKSEKGVYIDVHSSLNNEVLENSNKIIWCYITLTTTVTGDQLKQSHWLSDDFGVGGQSYPSQYVTLPFIYFNGNLYSPVKVTIANGVVTQVRETDCQYIFDIETISDERIVNVELSNIPPHRIDENFQVTYFGSNDDTDNLKGMFPCVVVNSTPPAGGGLLSTDKISYTYGDNTPVNIQLFKGFNNSKVDLTDTLKLKSSGYGFTTDFEDYCKQQPKLNFYPYSERYISLGETAVEMEYVWDNGELSVFREPSTGSIITRKVNDKYKGIVERNSLSCSKGYTPAFSKGEYNEAKLAQANASMALAQSTVSLTALRSGVDVGASAIHALTGIGRTLGLSAAGLPAGGSALGAIESTYGTVASVAKMAINVEEASLKAEIDKAEIKAGAIITSRSHRGNPSAEPSNSIAGFTMFNYTLSELENRDKLSVGRKMAVYGYDTTLQACEILEVGSVHKRVKYNYIQTSSCAVDNSLTAEANMQIKELFDGGVWLFSKYAFTGLESTDPVLNLDASAFNLEVVNYPLISLRIS